MKTVRVLLNKTLSLHVSFDKLHTSVFYKRTSARRELYTSPQFQFCIGSMFDKTERFISFRQP